jgi:hypothetical protein
MKLKIRYLVLPMVLITILGFLVANLLSVPMLAADSASCHSGTCNCSCSGPSGCACASKGGACLCECAGQLPDACLPIIFIP